VKRFELNGLSDRSPFRPLRMSWALPNGRPFPFTVIHHPFPFACSSLLRQNRLQIRFLKRYCRIRFLLRTNFGSIARSDAAAQFL